MDSNLKQEILRTIVANENRMTFASISKAHPTIRLNDLHDLQTRMELALVDGNWIVLEWWKVS